jgi:hypothetical protein
VEVKAGTYFEHITLDTCIGHSILCRSPFIILVSSFINPRSALGSAAGCSPGLKFNYSKTVARKGGSMSTSLPAGWWLRDGVEADTVMMSGKQLTDTLMGKRYSAVCEVNIAYKQSTSNQLTLRSARTA